MTAEARVRTTESKTDLKMIHFKTLCVGIGNIKLEASDAEEAESL